MSSDNESNFDSSINHSNNTMDLDKQNSQNKREGKDLETKQEKPKRKYTKRKQPLQPTKLEEAGLKNCGDNPHRVRLPTNSSGSTVQQTRQKRKRRERLNDELPEILCLPRKFRQKSERKSRSKPISTSTSTSPTNVNKSDNESNGLSKYLLGLEKGPESLTYPKLWCTPFGCCFNASDSESENEDDVEIENENNSSPFFTMEKAKLNYSPLTNKLYITIDLDLNN